MKRIFAVLICTLIALAPSFATAAEPLRVFLRAGPKTHGPGQHDGPSWLRDWKPLLTERGAKVDGAIGFPTAAQLENTDVLVLYSAEGGTIKPEDRANLDKFLKRGGGIVAIHDSVCGTDAQWFKTIIGGAWEHGHSKWYEGDVGIYVLDEQHPITRGLSNFDFNDEIYWDLHMMPGARVLASSFHTPFVIAPQLWVYEKDNYRAFVCVPGHEFASFSLPHFRALLLRGIAWAGKRANVDEFCTQPELASLKYPEGGPTAPDKASSKLIVHPEFNISLVASEPLIEKAISLDWDPQGRLWVAETPEYPNGRRINKNDSVINPWRERDPDQYQGEKESRPARDRISYLEDSNGDGVMDKKTVFYEGLELVTSLVFYKDGVIVAQAPDILWIRDTDGDGKADKVETLYTGFGTGDTHAVISNFRWGMDGWVYGTVGYSAGHPKSLNGAKDFGRVTAGVLRFKPDGSALEQIASGSCNTWGFDFTADNEIIYTTATCGEPICHVVMPEKVLARGSVGGVRATIPIIEANKVFPAITHKRAPYVQIDWVGAFTAAAGSCVYVGGAWPEKFNNSHFVTEPTVNLVHNEMLLPDGVSYRGSKEEGRKDVEFIAGTDLWFRPIHTRVGPDGALYVIDFYNQAAVHNDTRGPRHGANNAAVRPDRDHHLGRIWRVQHKEAKTLAAYNLNPKNSAELMKALNHPNGWVRMAAHRLLTEKGDNGVTPELANMLQAGGSAVSRLHALWLLNNLGKLDQPLLLASINDREPALRKNALKVVAEADNTKDSAKREAVQAHLHDSDPQARLQAIIALGSFSPNAETARQVVEIYPDLADKYSQSAAIGVAAADPLLFVDAAFKSKDPSLLVEFVGHVTRQLANKQDAASAAKLVILVAQQPASADGLKQLAVETLATALKPGTTPDWSPELQSAFKLVLASSRPGLPGAALPLIARWDKSGALADDLKPVITQLSEKLADRSLPDDQRAQVAVNLLGVRQMNSDIIPSVAKILGSDASATLRRRVIEAIGNVPDATAGAVLIGAYPTLSTDLHEIAFAQIIKRTDWSLALLQAIQERKIDLGLISPSSLHRLRTHSEKTVASRANSLIDELRGPEQKEKDKLITQFTGVVQQPGNVENGHKLFTANCATCHKFKGEGRDLAPDLTGMGAHGAADLLVHILDPNRLVEPNFFTTSIETKDDLSYDGIIARENRNIVVLRNATGDFEIKTDNIQSRRSTGLSLMPNGFEALGGDGLRDILGYICADETRFRLLDMKGAYTANSTHGIYRSAESASESLQFKKFGLIKVSDVPFEIVSPARTPTGNNVVVLKGGEAFARQLPQRVEISNVKVKAAKLHFLGGVGGWAWPCCGGDGNKNLPVAKVLVSYADGQSEEFILRNGVEIADWNGHEEVPGSKEVPDLLRHGQVRWFSKSLKHAGVIDKIALESFDNAVAPTFVAITAETADASQNIRLGSSSVGNSNIKVFLEIPDKKDAPPLDANRTVTAQASSTVVILPPASFKWDSGVKTLIVGGGSSHDFGRWFNQADSATLMSDGKASVNYTEQVAAIAPALKDIDVLYLSNNQPMKDPVLRKAIFDFAEAGKGLLLVHPALWYNWNDWPEYNRVLCGGGSRSHDKFGEFEVKVTDAKHPVMIGVPQTFKISDELYHFELDPMGTPIKVLATAFEVKSGKTYPMVWIVQHPKARIVCIALGHDAKAHEHPAYQILLQNSLLWVARGVITASRP